VAVTMVQLPGLNTPQFTWVRTTLRRRPRPVAPVFQPEVAARAIVLAADHPRREVWVGGSTVLAIVGNKLAPGLADRYLARTNVDAQQDKVPIDPARPDYLYAPVDEDRGAHGPYDAEAKPRSIQATVAARPWARAGAVALAAGGAAAAITAAARHR